MTVRVVLTSGLEDSYPDGMHAVVEGQVLYIKTGQYLSSDNVSAYPLVNVQRWDER